MVKSECIALVTVLYNCEQYLPAFFDCLSCQSDKNFLLIVVDNASGDRSLEVARQLASRNQLPSRFIANRMNLGVAVANNQGIELAKALGIEHLVLLNNDVQFSEVLLNDIRQRAIEPKLKAWTCLAYHGDESTIWYGGGKLSYWFARGVHFSEARSRKIRSPIRVSYAPTCLMYLHNTTFERVGMMDPQYFVYYDDTDFCKRMQAKGIDLIYDPTVTFRHYVGGSSGGGVSDFFLRFGTRNKFIYIRKHYSVPVRWLIAGIAAASKLVQLISSRRRRHIWQGLVDACRSGVIR